MTIEHEQAAALTGDRSARTKPAMLKKTGVYG